MLRRAWQSSMIALARSQRAKLAIQNAHTASKLARRYVAGATADAGIARAAALLSERSIHSSLFYLGEYVNTQELVLENVAAKRTVAALLGRAGLDVHVSVDPTQIGHSIDPAEARRNAFAIAEAIAQAASGRPGFHALMLDMEDQSVTDVTIALHDAIRAAGFPTALTLQAYLRRTEMDLRAQVRRGARVRLVKGAFAARRDVAFTSQAEIKSNSLRLIDQMFAAEARDAGFYPVVATHDEDLHVFAIERAETNGWRADEYEFEMLLGVRDDVAANLARRGYRVRLYVPFGRDWWPYAVRRIGENPRNLGLLVRSVLGGA
jgi:proline dehydrogenase